MSEPRKLRYYQYVNRPYEQVHAILRHQPLALLQQATTSAAARAGALAASLHVSIGGIEVGVDVRPHVTRVREEKGVAGLSPVLVLEIGWEATRAPGLFPSMHLELSAWPLSSTETQLELAGEYRPPLGLVGNALNAVVGHRIAEASVHSFLDDVVEQMKRDLPTST
ncbi:MAG TPA: hypothetical protein VGL81_23285 [Polyangiaceae bacterium]|jgi:hypothetical protein